MAHPFSLASVLTLLVAASVARAQPIVDIRFGSSVDPNFGFALAELGANLLVTKNSHPLLSEALLIDPKTGALIQTFENPDPSKYNFGRSVASVGGNVLVGAGGFPASTGTAAALLFDPGTGALIRTFANPAGPGFSTAFGRVVTALGTNVLVGAPGSVGAAYLFDGATGTLLRTFQAPTPANGDFFGQSIAVLGSNVLVGAPGTGSGVGAAYLFDAGTGALLQTFSNPIPADPSGFGTAVLAVGGNVLVGAPSYDGSGTDVGIAHLFDSATGALIRSFSPPTPESNRGFGYSLATFGGRVIIATQRIFQAPEGSPDPLAYVYDVATGTLERTLWNPTPWWSAIRSGTLVAIVDGHPVISPDGGGDGAVYVFCGGVTGCGHCQTCGPSGTCIVAPHPTCRPRTSGRAPLRIVNRTASDDRDLLNWRTAGEFADESFDPFSFTTPTDSAAGNDYTLCFYDESGGPPSLIFEASAPAGGTCGAASCWKPTPYCRPAECGFRYSDKDRTPHGVTKLSAIHSDNGPTERMLLKLIGRGANLSNRPSGLPTLPLPLPLRLQLQISGGLCWEVEYSAAIKNTSEIFKADAD